MRFLLTSLLMISSLWGQSDVAHKCRFAERPFLAKDSSSPQARDLDFLDESIVSPSGSFRIHFTRSGPHAVAGANQVGTPTFVTEAAIAADSSYSMVVDILGFLPPLDDGGVDGEEFDVYIKNNGFGYYGETVPEAGYYTPYHGVPAYLIVDNDFLDGGYATTGLEALRVTIAHEFFHMVQLRYAYPFQPVRSNRYWYEISSTWIEEVCYPEIDDYHAYVVDNFNQINFPSLNDIRFVYAFSYGHGLFGQLLDLEYGEVNGKHVMLDIWENLTDKEATENLDQVLSSSPWNSNLTQALGKYALYNVFTGSRAVPNTYYPDAGDLAELTMREYDLPEIFPDTVGITLQPFEIAFKKFNIPTLSDFYVRSDDLGSNQLAYLTYHGYENGSSLKSAISDIWLPCTNVSSQDYLIIPMVNGDMNTGSSFTLRIEGNALPLYNTIQALWPNPCVPETSHPQLSYMTTEAGIVRMKIYDLLGRVIYTEDSQNPEGVKVINLPVPANVPAGIYFVQLETKNAVMSRKFTVLR